MVAIGIVGAIAAMSIPSMVNNIQNRLLATQLKSITLSIKQLMDEQMIKNKTKDLTNTDFADPATLMTSSNFSIAETCATESDCWGTVIYKALNGNDIAGSSPGTGIAYGATTVRLKNGVMLSYRNYKYFTVSPFAYDNDDAVIGQFFVDLNGTDKPNIIGRDYFVFYITKRGKMISYGEINILKYTAERILSTCKDGSVVSSCFTVLLKNNWKMPY